MFCGLLVIDCFVGDVLDIGGEVVFESVGDVDYGLVGYDLEG